MIIFNYIEQIKICLSNLKHYGKTVGFVPTMGALHQGHISLIEKAKQQCDFVVSSIFVNPTQFNDLNDLKKYPRSLQADCVMLEKAGCDVVFSPEINEIYTSEEIKLMQQQIEDKTWMLDMVVDFGMLDKVMEGAYRKGHFNGVAQVVSKLFRIIEPDKAYFGQKDFQQLAIIRSMTKQLGMSIEIIGCPIVREVDGLAMSSRNTRLSKEQRELAPVISKILFKSKELYQSLTVGELKSFVEKEFNSIPQINLEYFEIVDVNTLQPILEYSQTQSAIACVSLKLGEIRLIDNVILY
jgi:pantoate--beta-alanine ligase